MDDEISLTCICDSTIVGNKLNSFKVELPYPLTFNQPFSLALLDISYPNLFYNINREGNYISLSFYKKPGSSTTKKNQIIRDINGEKHILEVVVSLPIQPSYYGNVERLTEYLTGYSKLKYDTVESLTLNSEVSENLLYIKLANCVYLSVKDFQGKNHIDRISDFMKNGIYGPFQANVHSLNIFKEKIISTVRKNNWFTRLNIYESGNKDLRNLWLKVISPEKFKHSKPDLTPIKKNLVLYDVIENLYYLSKKLFKAKLLTNVDYTISNILEYYLEFYFSFTLFLDFFIKECSVEVPSEVVQYFLNFNPSDVVKIKTIFDREKTPDIIDLTNTYPRTEVSASLNNNISQIQHSYNYLREVLKTLGRSLKLDFESLTADNQALINHGVRVQIDSFFNDFTKLVDYTQSYIQKENIPNNGVDYLKNIKQEFIYIDPELLLESNQLGKSEVKIVKNIHHEIKHFLKRITQKDYALVIEPLGATHYKSPRMLGKLYSDFTEVNFTEYELEPFFGHIGPLMVQKDQQFVTEYQPAIKLRNTNFFLYCDQIREQYVNELMTPLLATVPIPSNIKFSDPVHMSVRNPHFLSLKSNNLHELHFTLKNRQGESVKFKNSAQTIILSLLLRPTSRGVI